MSRNQRGAAHLLLSLERWSRPAGEGIDVADCPRPRTEETSGDRLLTMTRVFWLAVIAALFVLAGAQLYSHRPNLLWSGNGALTVVLAVADAAWFGSMMLLGRPPRLHLPQLPEPWRQYVPAGIGLVLTVGLVLLHREFTPLLFAGIGMSVFAIDGWVSLVPITIYGGLFLYEVGGFRTSNTTDVAGNLLSVVSVVALVYSLQALIRQRTARDRLIDELRETQRELRRAHAQEVELAALRERNRLAREMHDSLGHALVLIAMKIEAAQRLQARDPQRAALEWENTKTLVRSTMADLRSSLAGLRLPALEEQPLPQALTELAAGLQSSTGLDITVEAPEEAAALERSVQEAIYRVVQEALANVAKHARARQAWVRLEVGDAATRLEVTDDGIGLAAAPRTESRHYGVTGMAERVETLGGTLTMGPREGGGTAVRARLPMQEPVDVRHPDPFS